MNDFLRTSGKKDDDLLPSSRKPDGTLGRNKRAWKLGECKITGEIHAYDYDGIPYMWAPEHHGWHPHLDVPIANPPVQHIIFIQRTDYQLAIIMTCFMTMQRIHDQIIDVVSLRTTTFSVLYSDERVSMLVDTGITDFEFVVKKRDFKYIVDAISNTLSDNCNNLSPSSVKRCCGAEN